jgi:type I restriction enzyme M protein
MSKSTTTLPTNAQSCPPSAGAFEQRTDITGDELLAAGCNLDRKNPRAKEDITHLPPEELAASILKKEQRIGEIMGNIKKLLARP